uniref:astacin-like metalloendopeptidase isoform X2 n=1 Tax=Pristiophorus japonicus TaxID=55135 RepID=UPI00398F09A1
MDFTITVLLILSLTCNHLALVDNMNATIQDGLKREKSDTSESDVFSIILKANEELSMKYQSRQLSGCRRQRCCLSPSLLFCSVKRTRNKIIQYGDVLVDTARNAKMCDNEPRSCLWPSSGDGNVYIPYTLHQDYSQDHRILIKRSLDEIGTLTCVKFYYRRTNEPAYISVTSEKGCYSHVGYRRNKRRLSLEIPGCVYFGVILHEFLHAIGFHHEHQRSDRDKYITILIQNVIPGQQNNFNLQKTNNLGTEYDYGSIMHYGRTAFAKPGLKVMLPKPDSDIELGQYRGLTTKDVHKINKLYNCDICGNMLIANSGHFTTPNFPGLYPNNADCKWIIRGRRHFKILLEFSSFMIQEFTACIGDHLIIYDGANNLAKILDGPICGAENPAVMSTENELLITFTSTRSLPAHGFAASYRLITCGHMLKTSEGQIESKSDHSKDVHCFWVVLIKRQYKIILNVEELNIKNSTNCTENNLVIHDAARTPPAVIGKYCGKVSLPLNMISFGRTVVIEFQHKQSKSDYRFKISYKSIVKILLWFLEPLMKGVTTIILRLCHTFY